MPRHISVGESVQSLRRTANDGIAQIDNEYIRLCLWLEHKAKELHSDYHQSVEEPSKQTTKSKKKVGIKDKENVENSQPNTNIPGSTKSDPPITSENPRRSGRKKTPLQPTLNQAIDHSGETLTESSTSQEWQPSHADEPSNDELIHSDAEPNTAVVNNTRGSDQTRKRSAGKKPASVENRKPSLDNESSRHETKIDPIAQVPSAEQILSTPPKRDSFHEQKPSIVPEPTLINTEPLSYKAEINILPEPNNETPYVVVDSAKADAPTKLEKRKSPDSGSRHSRASSESSASKKQFSLFIPAQPMNVTNESFQSAVSTIPMETGNATTSANQSRKDSVVVIPDTPASQTGINFSTPLSTPAQQHTMSTKGKLEMENSKTTDSVARVVSSAMKVQNSFKKIREGPHSDSSKLASPHTPATTSTVARKIDVLSTIPFRANPHAPPKPTIVPTNTPKLTQVQQTSTASKQIHPLVTPSQPSKVLLHTTPNVEVLIQPESDSDYKSADEGEDTLKQPKPQTQINVAPSNSKAVSATQPESKKPATSGTVPSFAESATNSEISESTSGSTATGELSLVSSVSGSSVQFPANKGYIPSDTLNNQPISTPVSEAAGIHNPDRLNPITGSSSKKPGLPQTPSTPVYNKYGSMNTGNPLREPRSPFIEPVTPHSPHARSALMADKIRENAAIERKSHTSEDTLHHSIISGYKDSDDEDDLDDEDISPKKSRRPKWASPSKILRALRNETRNPEDIFFVESIPREVNLEEIFGTPPNSAKRTIYSKR